MDQSNFCIFLLFLASFLWYTLYYRPTRILNNYQKSFQAKGYRVFRLPYNPFSFPHFDLYKKDQQRFGDALKTVKELTQYDVIIGNFTRKPMISLLSTELIKQMCIKQADWNYIKNPKLIKLRELLISGGLFFDEGLKWKKKRRILNPVFNFKFVSGFYDSIKRITLETLDEEEQQEYFPVICVRDLSEHIFSKITIEGFIGGKVNSQRINGKVPGAVLAQLFRASYQILLNPVNQLVGPKLVKAGIRKSDKQFIKNTRIFNNWAADFIQKRIQIQIKNIQAMGDSFVPHNIIEAILFENYKSEKQGTNEQVYDVKQILEEFKIFFFAGTDTNTNMFNYMIFSIFSHPDVEQKLRQQIRKVSPDGQISFEITKDMKYLEAVQKQSLRMGGPFNQCQCRETVKDHYLKDIPIYKGTAIEFLAYTSHFNQEYYQKPYQFRPERWINGECEDLDPYAFVSFGGGSRACIGKQLAFLTTKIALILLLRRYNSVDLLCQKIGIHSRAIFESSKYSIKVNKNT